MRSNEFYFPAFVKGGIEDNEIASKFERKLWQKKWNLKRDEKSKKEAAPPQWSDAYVYIHGIASNAILFQLLFKLNVINVDKHWSSALAIC